MGLGLGNAEKAGWRVERQERRCGLWTESPQKGFQGGGECQHWRMPSSFVMDVFILKTKLPFKPVLAGLGQADGRRGAPKDGWMLRGLVQALPDVSVQWFILQVTWRPSGPS